MAIELDDGTVVRSLPEQVDYLTTHNEENEIAIDNLAARLDAAISGVLHYKGSVASYADLPADAEVGDVYNCLDTGSNYAWTGSEWDELGTTVDISNCLDKTSGTWVAPQEVTGIIDFKNGLALNSGYVELAGNTSEEFEIQLHGGVSAWTFDSSRVAFNYTNSVDLGSSTYTFKDLYLGGVIDFGSNAKIRKDSSNRVNILYNDAVKVKVGGGDTYFANNVAPDSNNAYDLGSSGAKWKNIYVAGNIDFGSGSYIHMLNDNRIAIAYGNTDYIKVASSATTFVSRIDPSNDNSQNIGRDTVRWKDLYLAGNLSNGTDSATVADIAALIAYAKAQGWIS